MGTKRTPINRPALRRITPEAVSMYREICGLDPIRDGRVKDVGPNQTCKLPWGEQCAACSRRSELSTQLWRLLGLMPWHYPFSYQPPAEPRGLSRAKLEAWWTNELETAPPMC